MGKQWRVIARRIVAIGVGMAIGVAILSIASPGLASVEVRLSRLESDVFAMRSQVDRLEQSLRSLQRSASAPPPRVQPPEPADRSLSPTQTAPTQTAPTQTSEAMFDRLATLFIELRDDLRALEVRVDRLEQED